MAAFVLVHGAWHGAWCWEQLEAGLEARGHAAIAVELPCEDQEAGCSDYARTIVARLADVDDEVILVGHSLGGLTIPLVGAARPVRRLVFLCALIPRPGTSLVEQLQAEPEIFTEGFNGAPARDRLGRSFWPEPEPAIDVFYHDCAPAIAREAAGRLRPQGSLPSTERCPLERWPGVPSSYILCSDDRSINPHWSRRAASERLGTSPVELPGSHSPFLSRPAALCDVLIDACV